MNQFGPRLLSVTDLAAVLGCSRQQVYRYVKSGLLDFCRVRIGNLRTVKFDSEKLAHSIDNGHLGAREDTTTALVSSYNVGRDLTKRSAVRKSTIDSIFHEC